MAARLGPAPHDRAIRSLKLGEIEKGQRIKAIKNVTINEPFFGGHFPNRPVMPGVLMLEAMAQAAALLAFDTAGVTMDDNTVYYFAGIDGARFKRPVEPGDQLVMDVALDRVKAGIYKFKGVIRVGDDIAELLFPRSDNVRQRDDQRARKPAETQSIARIFVTA